MWRFEEDSIWRLGGLGVKGLASRVWREIQEDDIWARAAQMSYYFLFALFPLLFLLTSVFGILLGSETGLRQTLFDYLSRVLPPSASELVSGTMHEVSVASGGDKITFGLLTALWAASNGMGAIIDALNTAYDVSETRSWWRARLTAIELTLALGLLIIIALIVVLFGDRIAGALASRFGLGGVFLGAWSVLQWPFALAAVLLAFALIYYFAPNLEDREWAWITPGSVIGVVLWLAVSFAFRVYLRYFDSYSATYGSLGAVIILMLWFYLSGLAILAGGEVNSEIRKAIRGIKEEKS
jgi:membrane protein